MVQWGDRPKNLFGHNFWMEGPIDLRPTHLNCIFCKIFLGTPHLTIFGSPKYVPKYTKYASSFNIKDSPTCLFSANMCVRSKIVLATDCFLIGFVGVCARFAVNMVWQGGFSTGKLYFKQTNFYKERKRQRCKQFGNWASRTGGKGNKSVTVG